MVDNTNHAAETNGQASLKDRVRELQLSNRLDGMKTAKGGSSTAWLPWMLCILLGLAWAGVGIRWYKGNGTSTGNPASSSPAVGDGATKIRPAKDQTATVAAGEIVLESKGYLIPSHSIPISPIDVAGRVIELFIEEGKTFKKGQILAIIDSTRYQADVDESIAQVAAAKARSDELESSWNLDILQSEYELAEAKALMAEATIVYETAKASPRGTVAKQEVDQTKKKLDAASERVKIMETKLSIIKGEPRKQKNYAVQRDLMAAEARYNRTKWSLDNCTIKAPVTGVILTKKAEKDSLINPVVGGVSTSLCEIADLSMIEVDLEIQERDIAKIQVGMTCKIRPDAYSERVYDGFVDRMMPIANRARGIIPVRVRVVVPADEEQGRYLKPEMGVAVTFFNSPYPMSEKVLPDFCRGILEGR